MDRRPLRVRSSHWAKLLASRLANLGLTPNSISVLSVIFASGVIFTGYFSLHNPALLLVSALLAQLRLICNLIDGMVAVEHNQSSANGEIFNDVPDRFADIFIIVGLSLSVVNSEEYFISPINLGWIGASLAVITAYVRVLGKSLGTKSYFIGPMAKQHRMFLVTVALIAEYFLVKTDFSGKVTYFALSLIALGSFVTVFRRLMIISNDLLKE